MTLRATLDADIKRSMLEKDEVRRDTLRQAKAEVLLEETKLGRDLSDAEVLDVYRRQIKSRRESIEQYRAAGRAETADREQQEIAVLEAYLPRQLDEAETRAAIAALVAELGLAGKKDLGRLMKELKARHPTVDGKLASQLAGPALG
jgi:uncharacterized protein YqeY